MASDIMALLQQGLQTEYQAIFLYRLHAREVADPELRAKFLEFGRMEQEHAAALGELILRLGGGISYSFSPLKALAKPLQQVIDEHLAAEQAAIQLYRHGIELALDEEMVDTFAGLVRDEQKHLRTLGRIRRRLFPEGG